MWEEDALAQQPLVSCAELDFGNGEGVAEMEGSVHVRVWEVSEPLGVLFLDLCGREALQLVFGWCICFEEGLVPPSCLVFSLYGYQVVSFSGLGM